jgi:large subunit ribosomal protein L4
MLQNIGLTNKKTLVVMPEKNEVIEKSLRNIPRTKTITAMYINPVDLLHYDKVLVFAGSLEKWDVLFA